MTRGSERALAVGIAAFALLRLLAFGSAFPFFDNIDEHRHVDAVLKYARGYRPGREEVKLEPHTAELLAEWGSPEYRAGPESFPSGRIPPPVPLDGMGPQRRAQYQEQVRTYSDWVSLQSHSPPVYYWIAGRWYALGRALGLGGVRALYFVRWLDAVALAGLVFASWLFLRRWFSANPLIRVGVPLLVAVYPNDFLYAVSDDVPTPLLGGLFFLLLMRATETPSAGLCWALAAGIAGAVTLLTKLTAVALPSIALVLAVLGLARALRAGGLARELARWGMFAAGLGLPFGCWLLRNLQVAGDATGMRIKSERMGIHATAPADWLAHPLFSLAGWGYFLPDLARNFWRGEFFWHGALMAFPWVDAFYVSSSGLALALAAGAWLARRGSRAERRCVGAALGVVASGVAMLAVMSVRYRLEWGNFATAWETAPYFSSGRYMAWAWLPFAIAYVRGIGVGASPLPAPWRDRAAWGALSAVVALALGSEIALSTSVFASEWNWFHLH